MSDGVHLAHGGHVVRWQGSFSGAVDKGTLDAVISSAGDTGIPVVEAICREVRAASYTSPDTLP